MKPELSVLLIMLVEFIIVVMTLIVSNMPLFYSSIILVWMFVTWIMIIIDDGRDGYGSAI